MIDNLSELSIVDALEVNLTRPVSKATNLPIFSNIKSEAGTLDSFELLHYFACTVVEAFSCICIIDSN